MADKLIASEALFSFAGWLTSRKEKTIMSSQDDAAPIADLVAQFCKENGLAEPREDWSVNLIHPCSEEAPRRQQIQQTYDDRNTQRR